MIMIAIVDDEKNYVNIIKSHIESFLKEQKFQFQIFTYTNPLIFLENHCKMPFDLIYMDIDMPEMNGINAASEIRKNGKDSKLIFVSSYSHFVFDTFQYSPFRFIRKEKINSEVTESICSYCKEFCDGNQIMSFLYENNITKEVDVTKIMFIFSLRHDIYTCIDINVQERLANREYTMESLENMLKEHGFIRIHKTYLVNYRFIHQIFDNTLILKYVDNEKLPDLPVSVRRLSKVKNQYLYFSRGDDEL